MTMHVASAMSAAANAVGVGGGRVFFAMEAGVTVFNVATGKEVCTMKGHHDFITSLAIDGPWLLTASRDGTVRVWDTGAIGRRVLQW